MSVIPTFLADNVPISSWIESLIKVDPLGGPRDHIRQILNKCLSGIEIDNQEAHSLCASGPQHLDHLCSTAAIVRNIGKGKNISFSPKIFLPVTRLCRDFCGYCTFRQSPTETDQLYMSKQEILNVAKTGQQMGCTEALLTLGERPEIRYPEARNWLAQNGHSTTLGYLQDLSGMLLRETRLLPHANPGTMSRREMKSLRSVNASMGVMLESTSLNLTKRDGAHEFAPSKWPQARLKTIRTAGELNIAFTTGILIGIGESLNDRIDSLLAIRELQKRYGHIQEVIIQNFRSKPNIPMEKHPDPGLSDLMWTIAVSRLILGAQANIQVPPNLGGNDYPAYLLAGINDWGGISPLTIDYVNPESPWPSIRTLNNVTSSLGFTLKPRLPIYPEYLDPARSYISSQVQDRISTLVDYEGYITGGIDKYVN